MKGSYTPGAEYSGQGLRIGVVSARFNGEIVEAMRSSAQATLLEHRVAEADVTCIHVPGAFELPLACKTMAETGKYDGIIALGCVIRGDTPHFEYVCHGCTSGIQEASLQSGIPIAFGLLTTDTLEQAVERSTGNSNKGRDVALCVLEMVHVLKSIPSGG
ncbi:MAG: 6,7-dimethyl-8-ribityllumazine synthase [Proteobacteria bacterium]|nr:6,7-dimethyl-8-ribityllumazine synthase [Pseudomonadota bacterium]